MARFPSATRREIIALTSTTPSDLQALPQDPFHYRPLPHHARHYPMDHSKRIYLSRLRASSDCIS